MNTQITIHVCCVIGCMRGIWCASQDSACKKPSKMSWVFPAPESECWISLVVHVGPHFVVSLALESKMRSVELNSLANLFLVLSGNCTL